MESARAHISLAAVVVVTVAAIACGSSSNSGNGSSSTGGGFPFTGPRCPPGTQPNGTQGGNATCSQCVQTQCPTGCLATDCSAYFTCWCACNPNDSSCAQGCGSKLSTACQSCVAGIDVCTFQTCGTACLGGIFDAGRGQ